MNPIFAAIKMAGIEMINLKIGLVCMLCGLWVSQSLAQEMTPRLFWPTPKGTKVLVAGYAYTRGDVLFDQSLPIEDADSSFSTGILGYTKPLNCGAGRRTYWSRYPIRGEAPRAN